MNKKIMQQALTVLKAWDALIKYQYGGSSEAMTAMQNVAWNTVDVIKALEIALAQPEQEPVAYWNRKDGFIRADQIKYISIWSDYYPEPLYALPTVSSENSMQAVDHGFDRTASHMAGEYVDTNQQNLNTSGQCVHKSDESTHEPIAWMYDWYGYESQNETRVLVKDWIAAVYTEVSDPTINAHNIRPLYAAPPRKEWVGLTDDEIKKIMQRWRNGYIDIKDVEAKLREKNNA